MKHKFFKGYLVTLALFLLFIFSSWRLLRPGYYSMQDDIHVFRLWQYHQCFKDHQLPCRYVPDAGFGYGYPLFNFYSPFFYQGSHLFYLLGFSLINSIKIMVVTSNALMVIGIFLLAGFLFNTPAAVIVSALYTLAPYHALNVYVRGAFSENLSLSILPILIYLTLKFIKITSFSTGIIFTLFFTTYLLSHNLSIIYGLPLIVLFIIVIYYKQPDLKKRLIKFSIFPIISLGISSYFLIPAIFEKRFTTVTTMTQGYFSFINHFVTLKQLFTDRNWSYGASLWGPNDDMSFQVGIIHWIVPLIFLLILTVKYLTSKNISFPFHQDRLALYLCLISILFMFLTHNRSTPLWQLFPFMPYFQFPWRFLGPLSLTLSLLSGYLYYRLFSSHPHPVTILVIIISLVTYLNLPYFKEDIWYPGYTDKDRLTPSEIVRQSGAGLKDYWPNYGTKFPDTYSNNTPKIEAGKVKTLDFKKNSTSATASFLVISDSATIVLPVVFFPKMSTYVDGKPIQFFIDPEYGLIKVNLPNGSHQLLVELKNTPVRIFSNIISGLSLIALFWLILSHSIRKEFRL